MMTSAVMRERSLTRPDLSKVICTFFLFSRCERAPA